MSIVPFRTEAVAVSSFDMIAPAVELAERIAGTDFVPSGLRGKPEAVLACILYGHEIGVGPMESLAEISVIEGRPAVSAQLMRARVLANGHELWAEESTTTKATLAARRAGDERVHRTTFTMDDARKAGLDGRPNWRRYPADMLVARATARLCRLAFPDVLGAARYVPDEVEGGEPPPDSAYAQQTQAEAPPKRTRRRPPPPAVTIAAAPPIEAEAEPVDERPPLPDEPLAPAPAPMTDPQRKKLHAGFRDAGITERTHRLRYASHVIGRELTSSSDMSREEAAAVIDSVSELVAQLALPTDDEPA